MIIQDDVKDDIQVLENRLQDIFGVSIDLLGRVQNELTQRKYTKPLYKRLIKQIDPEIVFIRYNPSKSTLIEVCQEVGIPVVELQHGVISNYHSDLSYDTPIEGEVCFPDVYFSWGEYWCNRPDFPINDVRVVGWPFLESVSKHFSSKKADDKILFISQPTNGEELSKIAVDINRTTEWEIIYRLHPNERNKWKSLYPWLESQTIDIDSGEKALYEVMSECWAQVGTESTALYEGLKFDLNTFIFDDFNAGVHPWYEVDEIVVFSDLARLSESLRNQESANVESNSFFEPDPIENIQREIAEITSSKKE
jgi:hypothetical protein